MNIETAIGIQTQHTTIDADIAGVPFALTYQSDRVPGRLAARTLDISLSDETVPESLKRIDLGISVAGQHHKQSAPPEPNQRRTFTWNRRDAYGRTVQGARIASIRLGYVYDGIYQEPADRPESFARFSGLPIEGSPSGGEFTLYQKWDVPLGIWDTTAQGLGGWGLSIHHAYDPVTETLHLGSGEDYRTDTDTWTITTVGGGGTVREDGSPALEASLNATSVDIAPDGSVYFAEPSQWRVRRIAPDGRVVSVAGTGTPGFSGDDGPATEARLSEPTGVVARRDGVVYIADRGNGRVRRVGSDGTITTVAGGGTETPDGIPADRADIRPHSLALGEDGRLYIAESYRVLTVEPDGVIRTTAGVGPSGGSPPADVPASEAAIVPTTVAVGPDERLYIPVSNGAVYRLGTDGRLTRVAGGGEAPVEDGRLATDVSVGNVAGMAIGRDGDLFLADNRNDRVYRISDGVIRVIAGSDRSEFDTEVGSALDARLIDPRDIAAAPDGSLYLCDGGRNLIRQLQTNVPIVIDDEYLVPSADGSQIFVFDERGRHLRTVDADFGTTLYRFEYSEDGYLTAVADADGNTTSIERSGSTPTATVSPYGQRTTFETNNAGVLARIMDPIDEGAQFEYDDGSLLTEMIDARGNATVFQYDGLGRLLAEQKPGSGEYSYVRSQTDEGYTVDLLSPELRESTHGVETPPSGIERLTNSCCGDLATLVSRPDGTRLASLPNGSEVRISEEPDQRFGMQAPVFTELTVETPVGLTLSADVTRSIELAGTEDDPFALSQSTESLSVNGRTFTRTIDASTRRLTIETPEGSSTVTSYDERNHVTAVEIDGIVPYEYEYDDRGRLVKLGQGDSVYQQEYGDHDRPIRIHGPEGDIATLEYDEAGRTTAYTTPARGTYAFEYDPSGNVTQFTVPTGAEHDLDYTPRNFLAAYSSPLNDRYTFDYDGDGNLIRETLPSDRAVETTYTTDGLLNERTYDDVTVTASSYDASRVGTLRWETDADDAAPSQDLSFEYDGNLVTRQLFEGATEGSYEYEYDENFFLTELSLPDGSTRTLSRNNDGDITGYGAFSFDRDGPAGFVTQISDNALSINIEYDDFGHVATRTHDVDSEVVYRVRFEYDQDGRVATKHETVIGTTRTYEYEYDAGGQLIRVIRDGDVSEEYEYDDNGNRTAMQAPGIGQRSARYNDQDQLLEQGERTYTYDPDGFAKEHGDTSLSFAARGELRSATLPSDETITYGYDGLRRRVSRADGAGTIDYLYGDLWNEFRLTATRDASGAFSHYHYDDNGRLFAFDREGERYYVATDHLGTPKVVVDRNGTPIKTIEHDTYGRVIADSDPDFWLPVGFAGGVVDRKTGLVRFGYRDYDPAIGRWIARDPELFGTGERNLYTYVDNDPVNWFDPDGLDKCQLPKECLPQPSEAVEKVAKEIGKKVTEKKTGLKLSKPSTKSSKEYERLQEEMAGKKSQRSLKCLWERMRRIGCDFSSALGGGEPPQDNRSNPQPTPAPPRELPTFPNR